MEDARRDGDRVRAVIRGTATNQDGRTGTITKPSRDAQVLVYRAALRNAGVDPDTVGRVEAHGTGTPVGAPSSSPGSPRSTASAAALARSVRRRPISGAVRPLPDLASSPRLYVVTRSAQQVLDSPPTCLDQAGLRGLVQVIGAEHPGLRPTLIDLEADTVDVAEAVQELISGAEEDETAWRYGTRYGCGPRCSPRRSGTAPWLGTIAAAFGCGCVRREIRGHLSPRRPGDVPRARRDRGRGHRGRCQLRRHPQCAGPQV